MIAELLPQVVSTVEIRTNATPGVRLNVAKLVGSGPSFISSLLKPTIILEGSAGRIVLAPNGEAREGLGLVVVAAVVISLVGVGYVAGRLSA